MTPHQRLLEAAEEARLQIEYLHERFKITGSGNAVLVRLDSTIAEVREQMAAAPCDLAVELLDYLPSDPAWDGPVDGIRASFLREVAAALAPREEPAAWLVKDFADGRFACTDRASADMYAKRGHHVQPLYAAPREPEQAGWRPSREEIEDCAYAICDIFDCDPDEPAFTQTNFGSDSPLKEIVAGAIYAALTPPASPGADGRPSDGGEP
jgi:hypothetical protein